MSHTAERGLYFIKEMSVKTKEKIEGMPYE